MLIIKTKSLIGYAKIIEVRNALNKILSNQEIEISQKDNEDSHLYSIRVNAFISDLANGINNIQDFQNNAKSIFDYINNK